MTLRALLSIAVFLAIVVAGCTGRNSGASPSDQTSQDGNRSAATSSAEATSSGGAPVGKHGDAAHEHLAGAHGGIIVSLGRDSYHIEAIVTSGGELQLYTLGNDESRVMDIDVQKLVAYVKPVGGTDSAAIELQPQPQPGDAPGKSSLFVAQLPSTVGGKAVDVTVPNITIGGERFRLGFTTREAVHADAAHAAEGVMSVLPSNDVQRELFLTAGGLYTEADIEANGRVTAAEKFVDFMANHDIKPQVGDKLCPITETKANAACSWIIGGKTYEFCCPPCVVEFVELAKTKPDAIQPPEAYVKKTE